MNLYNTNQTIRLIGKQVRKSSNQNKQIKQATASTTVSTKGKPEAKVKAITKTQNN